MRKQLLATMLCVCMVFGSAGAVMADEKVTADTAGEDIAVEEVAAEGADENISEEKIVPEASEPEAAEPETENTAGQEILPLMEGEDDPDPFEGYEIFDIVPGEETTVTINPDEATPLYRFVPDETGDYRFESLTDKYDLCADLYNENMEYLYGVSGYNTKLEYMLEAGNTYYFLPYSYVVGKSVSFTVRLIKYFDNHFYLDADSDEIFLPDGETKSLTVIPRGEDTSNITYQWYMYDHVKYANNLIEGANENSYAVSNPGQYFCRAEDGYGSKSSIDFYIYYCNTENIVPDTDKTVTIFERYQAALYKFIPEEDGGFIFSGSGEGMSFNLYLLDENRDIISENGIYGEGSLSSTLDAGKTYYYAVSTYNDVGDINVRLSSYTENGFEAYRNDYVQNMSLGTSQTLSVTAGADDERFISYEWFFNNEPIPDASASVLTIEAKSGTYKCRVEDGYGSFKIIVFEIIAENGFSAYADNDYITITAGEVRTLKTIVEALDSSRITYTWYFNDEPLEGANESSYAAALLNGEYRCHIDDGYGNSRDVRFRAEVECDFQLNLAGNTRSHMFVAYGDSAKLEVAAEGEDSKDVTYQWFRYENDEKGYVELEGETSAILNTRPVTGSTRYQCSAKNAYESYRDTYIFVDVENHFIIDNDINSINAVPGQSVELTVNAIADDMSGMKYEWYFYDNNEEGDYIRIENADGPSYTIDSVTERREYYCTVTDKYGTSRQVWFWVTIDNKLKAFVAGTEDESAEYFADQGSRVDLSVEADAVDKDGLRYTWRIRKYDEELDEYSWIDVDGSTETGTGSTLTVENVSGDLRYSCLVTDKYDNSCEVYFAVYLKDNMRELELNKAQVVEYDSEMFRFTPSESGAFRLSYSEYSANVKVYDEDLRQIAYEYGSGDNGGTQSVDVDLIEGKTYSFQISYDYNVTSCMTITLTKNNHLSAWTAKDEELNVAHVTPGSSYTMTVEAAADDISKITYQWYKIDRDTGEDALIEGQTGFSYTVNDFNRTSSYYCLVSDGYGNSEKVYFHLYIYTGLSAVDAQTKNRYNAFTVSAADSDAARSFTLKADVSADKEEYLDGLKYQWQKYDYSEWDYFDIEGGAANTNTYSTGPISKTTRYRCRITDKYGTVETVAYELNVIAAPEKINAGDEKKIVMDDNELERLYEFTPAETGTYTIESFGVSDTAVDLYNAEMAEIIGNDEDGGTDLNFRLSADLEAGKKYIYRVRNYLPGNFSIRLTSSGTVNNHFEVWSGDDYIGTAPGASASLSVQVHADKTDKITYKWYKNGEQIKNASQSTLNTGVVTGRYDYRCDVYDGYSNLTIPFWFTVYVANDLFLTADGEYNFAVPYGSTAQLKVKATAKDTGSITYQWYDAEDEPVDGANSPVFTTGEITRRTSYYCGATDKYGNYDEVWFNVSVDNDLKAFAAGTESDRKAIFVRSGEDVHLEVSATADDITGASFMWGVSSGSAALRIENHRRNNYINIKKIQVSRQYYCEVRDRFGNYKLVYFDVYVTDGSEKLEENKTLSLERTSGYRTEKIMEVTPLKNGEYSMVANAYGSDSTVFITIYDSNGVLLEGSGSVTRYNEAGDSMFAAISADLKAGVKYSFIITNYNDTDKPVTVKLTQMTKTISPDAIKLNSVSVPYAGDFTPVGVTVQGLVEYEDYCLEFVNAYRPGTATVIVHGIGEYKGDYSYNYTITNGQQTPTPTPTPAPEPEKTDISSGAAVTVSAATYTGKALTPAVTVTLNNRTLKKDTDYTVKYENNVNAGKGRVVITGTGSYKGTKTHEFTIGKAASVISLKAKSVTYNGKNQNIGAAAVTGSKGAVTYTYYSDSACKKKVTAHKKAGTYYVKAAVAEDANYLGNTSSAVKLTIKKAKQPLTVKGRTPALKAKTVKKKAQTIKASKAYKVTKKAQGKITYKKTKGNKNITVNKKTGAITVKKGLKKGTYSIKVKLTAAGNANYKGGSKTVTVRIKIK